MFVSPVKALVVDLGGVVFNWKPPQGAKVEPKMLKRAMSTLPWYEFERGAITASECYQRIGRQLPILPSDLKETLDLAEASLEINTRFMSHLRELKKNSRGSLKIYALSNIAKPHLDLILAKDWDWALFDQLFTSSSMGKRKPDLGIYTDVLRSIGMENSPGSVAFVDDTPENILAARSLGIRAVQFDTAEQVITTLSNMLGDPIARGTMYMRKHARVMHSTTNKGASIKENFTQLLILEATRDRTLVDINGSGLTWNFFQEKSPKTGLIPDDYDTTALAHLVLGCKDQVAHAAMDKIRQDVTADGIFLVYDDITRPRVDAIVCIHVATLFYKYGREAEIQKNIQWIHNILEHRAFLDGTLYYASADYFLFAVGRMIGQARAARRQLPSGFEALFKARCKERIGVAADAMSTAARIMACRAVAIPVARLERDVQALCAMQALDGGWPLCTMYRMPNVKLEIGSRGVSTAFAVEALRFCAGASVR